MSEAGDKTPKRPGRVRDRFGDWETIERLATVDEVVDACIRAGDAQGASWSRTLVTIAVELVKAKQRFAKQVIHLSMHRPPPVHIVECVGKESPIVQAIVRALAEKWEREAGQVNDQVIFEDSTGFWKGYQDACRTHARELREAFGLKEENDIRPAADKDGVEA